MLKESVFEVSLPCAAFDTVEALLEAAIERFRQERRKVPCLWTAVVREGVWGKDPRLMVQVKMNRKSAGKVK